MARLAVFVASFLLAVLSWKFVEQPFRHGRTAQELSFHTVTSCLLGSTTLLIVFAILSIRTGGFPQRLPTRVHAILADSSTPEDLKAMDRDAPACDADKLPLIGDLDPDQPISFLLWGDSHARAIVQLCDQLGEQYGIKGAVAVKSATTPLLGKWNPTIKQDAVDWNRAVFEYLQRHHIRRVFILARWSAQAEDLGKNAPSKLAVGLRDTTYSLSRKGIKAWYMLQVPEQPENPERSLALAAWRGGASPRGVDALQHEKLQNPVAQAFFLSALDRSMILDPRPYCFDAEGLARLGTRYSSYYRDTNHLSNVGAVELLTSLFQPIFEQIAESPQSRGSDVQTSMISNQSTSQPSKTADQ